MKLPYHMMDECMVRAHREGRTPVSKEELRALRAIAEAVVVISWYGHGLKPGHAFYDVGTSGDRQAIREPEVRSLCDKGLLEYRPDKVDYIITDAGRKIVEEAK